MSGLNNQIEAILKEAKDCIGKARTEGELLDVKGKYFGRKGTLSSLMKTLASLPIEERKEAGSRANEVKSELESIFDEKLSSVRKQQKKSGEPSREIDVTIPAHILPVGKVHPVSQILYEIIDVFSRLGFTVYSGPDIETDYYNFEALNIPQDHPARDMQDTFYVENLEKDLLLRTHTSPIQIRVMEKMKPPVRVIAPGTVYRCDSDITHSPMFHQVEGFAVDRDVTFADLKGVLTEFCSLIFNRESKLRFRPSFFPFTEPSAEVDIECVICRGKGCRVCSDTGWLEILGCGMIDPEVFRFVEYDFDTYSGFAFGMGVERIAMLRFGIHDIRIFFENDVRFLAQF